MNKIGSSLDTTELSKARVVKVPDYVVIPSVLSKKECVGVSNFAKSKGKYTPGLIGTDDSNVQKQQGIRDTELWWFYHHKLDEKISDVIYQQNKKHWKYRINETEFFQYGEYNIGGHYSWHRDAEPSNVSKLRKLSFSIVLNDRDSFEGGKFQMLSKLDREGKPVIRTMTSLNKVGSILIFPSTTTHRVTPVTKGTRRSLVGWVWGPQLA
jgi:PKHD-type hydroxylase